MSFLIFLLPTAKSAVHLGLSILFSAKIYMISRNLSRRLWSGRTERFLSIRAVFLSNGGDAAWTAKKCWELSRKAHRHLEAHWAVRLLMLSWFSKLRNGRRYFSVFSEILEDQQQWIITKKVKNLLETCVGGIVKKKCQVPQNVADVGCEMDSLALFGALQQCCRKR